MQLLDNINRLLGDDLKQTLKHGARLKIAASCFSMYAYEALKAELKKIDGLALCGGLQNECRKKFVEIQYKSMIYVFLQAFFLQILQRDCR